VGLRDVFPANDVVDIDFDIINGGLVGHYGNFFPRRLRRGEGDGKKSMTHIQETGLFVRWGMI